MASVVRTCQELGNHAHRVPDPHMVLTSSEMVLEDGDGTAAVSPSIAIRCQDTAEFLEEQGVDMRDGTMLAKIYGEQVRKKQGHFKWPQRSEGTWPFLQGTARTGVRQVFQSVQDHYNF